MYKPASSHFFKKHVAFDLGSYQAYRNRSFLSSSEMKGQDYLRFPY